ncbi:GerAB/ArcD/ProY family transporter [Paenibacillus cymbidii]|uniref:GerAB/ArcD/ProY family transporter n=1 Tax=Paenibacillus cymbidii TaxID=1639034 RepID=UPI00143683D2|nr:GerAB/ArcD/ProY family transporter [Paenibacillus cymbidii]
MKSAAALKPYEMLAVQTLYFGAAAGFIYPGFLIRSTAGAYWIPIVVWTASALLSSWLYSRMLGRLKGGRLIESFRSSIGAFGTGLLCLPIALCLLGALVVTLRAYSEMVTMTMLPTTPISFLNGMALAPVALAMAGMMPIVRTAKLFFLISLLFTVALLLLGLSDIHWSLGAPWLRTNGDFLADKRFYAGSFLWMGFAIVALTGPYTRQTARSAWSIYALALLVSLPILACYIYLPVLTFGRELSQRMTLPFISKMDTITHYWVVFENVTAIFVSVAMLNVLFVMALMVHALGETIRPLAPRAKSGPIYGALLVVVYAAATALASWRELEQLAIVAIGFRVYMMFAFPLLGLLILRRSPGRLGKGDEA